MLELQCPIPLHTYPTITMAHGGGGRLTHMLIEQLFVPSFANPALEALHDGAILTVGNQCLAFATDAFTISPIFFPGGNIGSLAIHGTVNDLAMCGAMPLALSASFILEEGLPIDHLWRVVQTMHTAAAAIGVPIVTGDTKVVERNKGDGIFITTTGIGLVPEGVAIAPTRIAAGDVVIVSGPIAVHGIAILALREGLEFETTLKSDTAPLHQLVSGMLEVGGAAVHALRDPTRGGVASALNELARKSGLGILLDERLLPLDEEVRAACEIFGLDPLYVANEGICLAIVAPQVADAVLERMHAHPLGSRAAVIGMVSAEHAGMVVLQSRFGGKRVVEMLSGEQLPRIC